MPVEALDDVIETIRKQTLDDMLYQDEVIKALLHLRNELPSEYALPLGSVSNRTYMKTVVTTASREAINNINILIDKEIDKYKSLRKAPMKWAEDAKRKLLEKAKQ